MEAEDMNKFVDDLSTLLFLQTFVPNLWTFFIFTVTAIYSYGSNILLDIWYVPLGQ